MSEQLQLRRGTAAQVQSFTGAQGEAVVDTSNNQLVIQDGATAGGFAAAKLSEVITNARTAVSDASYAASSSDRMIAYTALTSARTVTLPAASSFPTGTRLLVLDESGACSAANTITLSRAGSDLSTGRPRCRSRSPMRTAPLNPTGQTPGQSLTRFRPHRSLLLHRGQPARQANSACSSFCNQASAAPPSPVAHRYHPIAFSFRSAVAW